MADDKKKDGEGKEAPKKKGLPPLVLIATGAIAGGAGVVFARPPQPVEIKVQQPAHEYLTIQHPDLIECQFNPRTQAGKAFAQAGFYFVYTVRDDREGEAFESIRAHWDRARSNVLLLLGSRTMTELLADNGKRVLARDLTEELDATLFPGRKDEKVARVTEILFNKWMVQ